MRLKLQTRIFLTFVQAVLLFTVLGAIVGAVIISHTVLSKAQRRVEITLVAAWSAINSRLNEINLLAGALATEDGVRQACESEDPSPSRRRFDVIMKMGELDFLTLVNKDGRAILRGGNYGELGDDVSREPFIFNALQNGRRSAGFAILSAERLRAEQIGLDERAFVVFEPTDKAKPLPPGKDSESSGLALVAAVPIFNAHNEVCGVVYGGALLNRNHDLVDKIRTIVYEDEKYKGRHLGTVTIFQRDVRIATNVVKADGNRAIGTRVSAQVNDHVLENHRSFYDRAFVVDDWYLSAYDPIRDIEGKVVGVFYVGVLASKYDDIKYNLWLIYGLMSVGAAGLVTGIGAVFSRRLTGSLKRLTEAANKLSAGELDHTVEEPEADDEILDLTRDFNAMAKSLRDREEKLREANEVLKQLNANYLDMLGFVSHELKNTLGTIFTAAHSLNSGLVGELTPAQARMAANICRNISSAVSMTRNYLDLARIEKGELLLQETNFDFTADIAGHVLEDYVHAIADKKVKVANDLPESIPMRGDAELLRVVFKNLIDNALKYGREGGSIRISYMRDDVEHRFEVWNEGEGLAPDKIKKLFEKFERLQAQGQPSRKGTGLGLFITREIVEKHGGQIWAKSAQGSWISFIFTLPIRR